MTADVRAASSDVGNAALIEREVITVSLDHTFGFELANVGAGAIEVQRQCRSADGLGPSGSRSRGRLGDGREPHSCCVAAGYSDCSFGVRKHRSRRYEGAFDLGQAFDVDSPARETSDRSAVQRDI